MRAHLCLVLGLLAVSSPASAQPEEDGARVPYFQRDGLYRPPRSEQDWVRLVSPTPTRHGTQYVVISRDMGWFRSLRVEAMTGIVMVRRISIETHNHTWKTFYPNRRLDKRHPTLHVDLGSSAQISQIVITTDRRFAGTYTVYGSSGRRAPIRIAGR